MLIKDLPDKRDREFCERAERAASIRTFKVTTRGRAGFIQRQIPNYDAIVEHEFQVGIPYTGEPGSILEGGRRDGRSTEGGA